IAVLVAVWRRRCRSPQAWATFAALATNALVAGLFNNVAGQAEYGHALGFGLGLALAALAEPRVGPIAPSPNDQ
ncbi:MAG: hypothetical protein H0X45_05385, partial [Planctomycetes bacterium]|nr:hypothetical protein [Planctomycetota bacterium]